MEQSKHIFTKQVSLSAQKAAEDALLDVFLGRYEEANTGFKIKSYFLLEGLPTEMNTNASLDDVF